MCVLWRKVESQFSLKYDSPFFLWLWKYYLQKPRRERVRVVERILSQGELSYFEWCWDYFVFWYLDSGIYIYINIYLNILYVFIIQILYNNIDVMYLHILYNIYFSQFWNFRYNSLRISAYIITYFLSGTHLCSSYSKLMLHFSKVIYNRHSCL